MKMLGLIGGMRWESTTPCDRQIKVLAADYAMGAA